MNNYFIKESGAESTSVLSRYGNKLLKLFGYNYQLQRLPDSTRDMNTIEQRINYYHLLSSVLANDIEGEVVELGCFTGQCALLFQKILEQYPSSRKLHLYDSFQSKFTIEGDVEEVLKDNFRRQGLAFPVLHKGFFSETLPGQLPEKISFLHIDCGFGGNKLEHKEIMLHCLESVYPRMTKGAIGVLMDYYDPSSGFECKDHNPGVKLACDDFFAMKPEKIISLYGNQYSHGFFRKA